MPFQYPAANPVLFQEAPLTRRSDAAARATAARNFMAGESVFSVVTTDLGGYGACVKGGRKEARVKKKNGANECVVFPLERRMKCKQAGIQTCWKLCSRWTSALPFEAGTIDEVHRSMES